MHLQFNVGLINRIHINNYTYNKKVGLINQAPTEYKIYTI